MDTKMESVNVRIEGPVYSYEDLLKEYSEILYNGNVLHSLKTKIQCLKPSIKSIMKRIIPFPFIMASFYSYKFLLNDLIAGITMLMFHIPHGMAYGLLAGLQPIHGLYASLIPPLVYSFFGTSRHISIGTLSIVCILLNDAIMKETTLNITNLNLKPTGNDSISDIMSYTALFEREKLNIAISTTLLAGIFQFIMGLCRFGFIMNFINDSLIEAFTTATSFHIITSQLDSILGYSIDTYSGMGEFPYKIFLSIMKITELHCMTISISIGCIVVIFLCSEFINPIFQKKFKIPFPYQLILIILATVVSYYGNISTSLSVKIIGPIPKGLPSFLIPDIKIMRRIVFDAFIIAITGSVMSSALTKAYAVKFSYGVNYNQELVAYGLSNMLGSFFQCTISAASLSRSLAAVEAGMMSQFASMISCVLMIFPLLFMGPLFKYIPKCVLSAIIISSFKGMIMQLCNLPGLYRISRYDFYIWIFTFSSILLLNVPMGLTCGFLFSLLTIIIRLQNPNIQILGQLPNTNIYKGIKCFEEAKEIRRVKIYQFEAPLYFANSEIFRSELFRLINIKSLKLQKASGIVDSENHNGKSLIENGIKETILDDFCENHEIQLNSEFKEKLKFLIIDFSCIIYIDSFGVRVLEEIYCMLQKLEISLLIAAPTTEVRRMFELSKFANQDVNQMMFVTVHDAVLRSLQL